MSNTIPSDVHSTGDTGHTADHNNISDMLGLLTATAAMGAATFAGSNAANVAAVQGSYTANWVPADAGFKGWSFDPATATTQIAPTGGVIWLVRVNVRAAAVCSNVVVAVLTGGATLTAGANFAGLYTSTGAKVALTADQSGNWTSTGVISMPLAGAPYTLAPGFYFVALVAAGTTRPSFATQLNLSATTTNAGLAAAAARAATNGTGATLPASFTLSSNAAQATVFFAGLT